LSASPTKRTLAHLRKLGYIAAVAERWNPHARIRQDLLGFIDVIALRADKPGVLAIQCTSRSNLSSRRAKVVSLPTAKEWLAAGNRVEVWGWAKQGNLWHVKRVKIYLADLCPNPCPNQLTSHAEKP